MKIKVFTLNSFAKSIEGGNPAGVVINADFLSENDMKRIARKIGYSETAFIMKSDLADFKVRFFTPQDEVDLCGHATIASFFVLSNKGYIKPGKYSQETKAGILNVEVREDYTIMMEQNNPKFYEILNKEEVVDSLNITKDEVTDELPIQIVSTGLKDIIVPVKNLKILQSIKPDFNKVAEISKKYDVIGYHIFTLETLYGSMAHCRNIAPLYGILEEPATGTSNGALSCYLFKYGKINPEQAKRIIIEQGYSMKKPSEIVVSLKIKGQDILEVMVGGIATNVSEIEIEI